MTSIALLWLFAAPAPLIEVPVPGAAEVALEAVVRLPELTQAELALLPVLAEALPRQTQDYVPSQMAQATLAGLPPRASVMSDHLRISMTLPSGNIEPGLGVMESLLRRASLSDADVRAAHRRLAERPHDPWREALLPAFYGGEAPSGAAVRSLYARLFVPDAMFISAAGAFPRGTATAAWDRRVSLWKPARAARAPEGRAGAVPPPKVPSIELRSPTVVHGDVALGTRLLALICLGSGKDSALFRIARQGRGWSYRQEAVLWPVPGGWQPRLLLLTSGPGLAERAEELRKLLLAEVERWTDGDRRRGLGMAVLALQRDPGVGPVYLSPEGPPGRDLDDLAFSAAFWHMKTNGQWDPERLGRSMRAVTLADLRETAGAMLSQAKSIVRAP